MIMGIMLAAAALYTPLYSGPGTTAANIAGIAGAQLTRDRLL